VDDLLGALLVAPGGDDLDQLADEQVAGGEQEVKQDDDLDDGGDDLLSSAEDAGGGTGALVDRTGSGRGGRGAVGDVLDLVGDRCELVDRGAEALELLFGGLKALGGLV